VVSYGCEANLSTNTVTVELLEASTTNPADVEYALDGGAFQPGNMFFNVAPGLDHFVDVRHVNGCVRRTELFDIDNIEPLTLNLEEGRINEIIANASGGTGNYQFSFEGEPEGNENSFFISESGTFTVVVTDSNGCTVSASIPLEFIDICIPNIFNPSIQEGFGPGCADQFENLELDIFDRYGRRIASIDINSTWDGTYNGSELPTGDYWYIVKLNDENDDREFVGHFTLYR
jgi:gliding motility-associated-like protein